MLSFNQYLQEIFNEVYPFKRYASIDNVQYEFNTKENKRAVVVFILNNFSFDFISKEPVQGWELFFHVGNDMHVTGEGDAFAIFATVIEITKDFIKRNDPEILVFCADKGEKSRVDLYASMVKKMTRQTEYAYNKPNKLLNYQEFVLYKPR